MRSLFLLFSFVLLTTCSGNSVDNPNCRFLLEGEVNLPINLNLPEYSQLQFDLQSVYVRDAEMVELLSLMQLPRI